MNKEIHMPNQLVSVIVPVYNAGLHIERCLKSLVKQTYPTIEIIIIDDGSTDNSLCICNSYAEKDKRFIIHHQKNQGVSIARNTGISRASGTFVCFVDADDTIEPEAISYMVNEMQKYDVDCVRTNYYLREQSGKIQTHKSVKDGLLKGTDLREYMQQLLTGKDSCYSVLLLMKKATLESGIRFEPGISMQEDVLFYVDILYSIQTMYICDRPTYNYYWNEGGATKSLDRLVENAKSIIKVYYILEKKLGSHTENKKLLDAVRTHYISQIASRLLTASYQEKRYASYAKTSWYVKAVHSIPAFNRFSEGARLESLPKHLEKTADYFNRGDLLGYYFTIRIRRTFAIIRKLYYELTHK